MIVQTPFSRQLPWTFKLTLALLAVSTLSLLTANGAEQDDAEIIQDLPSRVTIVDDVIETWRARSNEFGSIDVKWSEDVFRRIRFGLRGMSPGPGRYTVTQRLMVDQEKRGRYERRDVSWSSAREAFQPQRIVYVHDGKIWQKFVPETSGERGFPYARISDYDTEFFLYFECLPIGVATRSFENQFEGRFDLGKVRVGDEVVEIDGTECIAISVGEITIWVDQDSPHLARRYTRFKDGKPNCVVDLTYDGVDLPNGFPSTWTAALLDGQGKPYLTRSGRVLSLQTRKPIEQRDLKIDFPVGTWVTNKTLEETYVVLANGKRRIVLPGEFNGHNYNEILQSEEGALLR